MYERNCVFIDIDDTIGMIAYTYPIEILTHKKREKSLTIIIKFIKKTEIQKLNLKFITNSISCIFISYNH